MFIFGGQQKNMKNIYTKEVAAELVNRIQQIKPNDMPLWGKMSADQMFAHCNVSYDIAYTPEQFNQPGAFKKFLLKTFLKKIIVGEKEYPKNSRTAPEFIVVGKKDFEKEKAKLIAHVEKTQQLGASYFAGKDNLSFGVMSAEEWNNLFYKHLDHHLRQFGK
jgi:hypothetical protein